MSTLFWQIAPELELLRRQVDELFGEAHPQAEAPVSPSSPAPAVTWQPRAALHRFTDRYVLQIQIPGVDSKGLDIEATRDRIVVKGDRPAPQMESAKTVHSEFRYGRFERLFQLPEEIDNQAVTASYEQGLLTLTLPKLSAVPNAVVKVSLEPNVASAESTESSDSAESTESVW